MLQLDKGSISSRNNHGLIKFLIILEIILKIKYKNIFLELNIKVIFLKSGYF